MKSRLGIILVCSLLVLADGAVGQERRYRKHVQDMSPTEWKALSVAIGILRSKPATDPLTYEHFVRIHGGGSEPTEAGCEHFSELIWPWHRAYLLHFENALNAVRPAGTPVITLPYWDWTEVPSGNNCYPSAYEDPSSNLYDPRRNTHQQPCAVPWPHQDIEDKLVTNDWQEFGGGLPDAGIQGSLESGPHDTIHPQYIGGDNRSTRRAADDPLFWAHHAYMDLLVAEWQARHPDAPHCVACDAVAYSSDPSVGPIKVKDLLRIDRLPMAGGGTIEIVYVPKGKGIGTPEVFLQSLGMLSTARAGAPPIQPREVSSFIFTFPDLRGSRLLLRLSGVSIPKEHPYSGAVFIYPLGGKFENSKAFLDKYEVGRFSEIANEHLMEHGNHALMERGVSVALDLTAAANRKLAPVAGRSYILTIVFEALEVGRSYADISSEVRVSGIRLQRRDFAVTEDIKLTPKD